jgi:hypothetical protein
MPHSRELLRSITEENIRRIERLAAATHHNEERFSLMELRAAEQDILDQLAFDACHEEAPGQV